METELARLARQLRRADEGERLLLRLHEHLHLVFVVETGSSAITVDLKGLAAAAMWRDLEEWVGR